MRANPSRGDTSRERRSRRTWPRGARATSAETCWARSIRTRSRGEQARRTCADAGCVQSSY